MDEKNLNKLKQGDRIEYLLKLDRLEKKYNSNYTAYFTNVFLITMGFIFVILLEAYHIFSKDIIIEIISSIKKILVIYFILLISTSFIDFIKGKIKKEEKKELEYKFFELKVKKENK